MRDIGSFLNLLKHVKPLAVSNQWQADCPCSNHKTPAKHLSIGLKDNTILVTCFGSHSAEDIVKSLGLEMTDLFIKPDEKPVTPVKERKVAEYSYCDEEGKELFQVVRFDPKDFRQRHKNGGGDWLWNLEGVRRVLYHLPEVLKAEKVYLVEGEKDADNLIKAGVCASTSPGGASNWRDEYAQYLTGKQVVIIPDNDPAGLVYAKAAAASLKGKATDVKCLILEDTYKDISVWLETGRTLEELGEQNVSALNETEKPKVSRTINGFSFTFPNLPMTILIDRLTNDAEGIIIIKDASNKSLHTSKINLLAPRSLKELSNRLNEIHKTDWNTILAFVTNYCFDSLRDGGETINVDEAPVSMKVDYLLYPILPMNEPVTIFTAGGKGKSVFADFLAVLVQHGRVAAQGLGLFPRQANVLILDWEADEETHRRYIAAIKVGLGIEKHSYIAYRRLEFPLAQVIESVHAEIVNRDIGLVILDSQMAATASGTRGLTEAQTASEYYNLIRSFHCATLTIDHITKASMSSTDGAEAPYGSIVKYNRSRSQFELRLPDEDEDEDHKEYALVHRKFNLGRKQKPLGIACDFVNDGDTLVRIDYYPLQLGDNLGLENLLPLRERVRKLLFTQNLTQETIADKLGFSTKQATVRTTLNRNKDWFEKIGDVWKNIN